MQEAIFFRLLVERILKTQPQIVDHVQGDRKELVLIFSTIVPAFAG
jgi:hypothetical protein